MTTRTTKSTVTFARPFILGESGELFPAGRYSIETDEELLEGISFPVYHRTATMMQLDANPSRRGISEVILIDPQQLEAALAADAVAAPLAKRAESHPLIAPGHSIQGGKQPDEALNDVQLTKAMP